MVFWSLLMPTRAPKIEFRSGFFSILIYSVHLDYEAIMPAAGSHGLLAGGYASVQLIWE